MPCSLYDIYICRYVHGGRTLRWGEGRGLMKKHPPETVVGSTRGSAGGFFADAFETNNIIKILLPTVFIILSLLYSLMLYSALCNLRYDYLGGSRSVQIKYYTHTLQHKSSPREISHNTFRPYIIYETWQTFVVTVRTPFANN